MKKLLIGLTAAAVMAGGVALGARPASADDQATLTAMLAELVAMRAQLIQIEQNTRPLADAQP
jgi:hypothetical protein